jgi:hypothetical protein
MKIRAIMHFIEYFGYFGAIHFYGGQIKYYMSLLSVTQKINSVQRHVTLTLCCDLTIQLQQVRVHIY